MKLTEEQEKIIASDGDCKINAVAGSGKTTTILHYAKARKSHNRILYLAFNKSVKNEAAQRFSEMGLDNVHVATAHSLAYSHIMRKYGYKLSEGYRPTDLVEMLSLRSGKTYKDTLGIAYHALALAAAFCNSSAAKVRDISYTDILGEDLQADFVHTHYEQIKTAARKFLGKMDAGEAPITHDFYLKKFHLDSPTLNYSYILFDEGQDASPAMLDVFLKQNAVKVIVGDSHQQIYGWRFAVNSMEKVDFPVNNLTHSFRFPQNIADLAVKAVEYKKLIEKFVPISITGRGKGKAKGIPATIARTNLLLLVSAIESVVEKDIYRKVYFEGGMHTYLRNEEGGSIYDVYNLYDNQRHRIKDDVIAKMKDIAELQEYATLTGDHLLSTMVDVVEKYGRDLPSYLKELRVRSLPDEKRHKADMIYTTVHKSKGLEYPVVHLTKDFVNEKKIKKLMLEAEEEGTPFDADAVNEEINILYVAITRAMNEVIIPREVHPLFQHIESAPPPVSSAPQKKSAIGKPTALANRGLRWDFEEDQRLIELFEDDHDIAQIARIMGRTPTAIRMRLEKKGYL